MDWIQLGQDADRLLAAIRRFSGPVPQQSVMAVANEDNPSWETNPAIRRRFFRALDVLERLELVRRPDFTNLAISDLGMSLSTQGLSTYRVLEQRAEDLLAWAEIEEINERKSFGTISRANTFAHLHVEPWRQFDEVDISFHPRLTIITGANAAGKTTLLNILAPHFNWSSQLLSLTPVDKVGQQGTRAVGHLIYSNGARTSISQSLSAGVSAGSLNLTSQDPVPGIFINSHRSISAYQPLPNLPVRFSATDTLLQQFVGELQARSLGGSSQFSPLFRMKEALVAAAMHGYGNPAVAANSDALAVWEGYQVVLADFLPESFGFLQLLVEDGDIVIVTRSGRFPLEAASGGLSAMLELSWQIYLRGRDSDSFTVCIDEPENHLHPELQRSIVPSLLRAFPRATLILATHSPFVVTAEQDAHVYALKLKEGGRVTSARVRGLSSSATADDALMKVLGLDTALSVRAEDRLQRALGSVPPNPSANDLRHLRNELSQMGLADRFPSAVEAIRGHE